MTNGLLTFLAAHRRFEAIDRERDQLLAPIDCGQATKLSIFDQMLLARLNAELSMAYEAVQDAYRFLPAYVQRQLKEGGFIV